MKSIIAAGSLILAAIAMPTAGFAQDSRPGSAIIVTGKYQKDWTKGSKLEAEGLKDLEKAKKELVRYSANVVDSQNKRDSSRARADNASSEFRKLTSNMGYFSDAGKAAKWAGKVEEAASDWAKYDDRRGDGREDLEKATKRQNKAQTAVDKAQAKVDRGRTLKAEAERMSTMQTRK